MQSKTQATLIGENALREDIHQPWEQDNQAWWDWYVTLAENEPIKQLQDVPSLPSIELPDDEALLQELATPYPLLPEQGEFFRTHGYIKLKQVLSPGAVLRLRQEIVSLLGQTFQVKLDGGTTERFLSMEMFWLTHPLLRAYVLSPRIARIAAELLDVARVRLYHDNILSKEPGCGRTPWHYDDHHFPLDTNQVVTAWVPAQPIPAEMGPLAFAYPLDVYRHVESVEFNKFDTSYDRHVQEVFTQQGVQVDQTPFAIGEVSFHHNLSFHTATANRTKQSRIVLANTYYEDGVRIVDSPTMVSGDWQKFMPGVGPGEVAATSYNPVCWPPEADLENLPQPQKSR